MVDVKPLWMCFIMLLFYVLWEMLLPYALVEDVKQIIRAICFVADVITTVADGIGTIGKPNILKYIFQI